jgi:hypothetical protein
MTDMETSLSRLLYRFDCPDAHTLGEYVLDVLDSEERVSVASHAAGCDECMAELHTLRTFLATDPPLPETTLDRVRRVVATLFAPTPELALGTLRGPADAATRQYEAEDVTISLGRGLERGSLIGLMVGGVGRTARLDSHTSEIDDLGNFEFEGVQPGAYTLELELEDRVVVIETLQID